jgi:hypothetical protein
MVVADSPGKPATYEHGDQRQRGAGAAGSYEFILALSAQ